MDPARWRRIEDIYQSAAERKPGERDAFLAAACDGDEELRREVESLLAQQSVDTPLDHPALDLAAGSRLGPYELLEPIGQGGMGAVFKARDTRLDRSVAIKVSTAQFSGRFANEARAVAALNHPHVCILHDVGPNYLVMELVEGENLAERLRKGPLPLNETLRHGVEIADAAAEAHAHGIIHRDLKPANIMLTKSGVKVLDFGLAKFETPPDPGQALTASHAVIGTVAYMSPEQAEGEVVDARSDIFSLGTVLYEMVTGRRPFQRGSEVATLAAILHEEPEPLSKAAPCAPAELVRIIERCMRKDPESRFQHADEVRAELEELRTESQVDRPRRVNLSSMARRWLWPWGVTVPIAHTEGTPRTGGAGWRWPVWVGVLVVVAILATAIVRWAEAPVKIASLAVLPMENLSGDAGDEYLADGMTGAVISSLAQVRSLEKVISRRSVLQFKGAKTPVPEIARKLGVRGIVEGTVQREGERVRVTVQLIDAGRDRHIWSRSYDRDLRDVLMLQNEIAKAIAEEVQAALAPEERQRLAATRKVNPEAYKLYARGRRLCDLWSDDGLRKSIPAFQQALMIDREFSEAHSALGECLTYFATWGLEMPAQVWPRAKEAVNKALELDPRNSSALVTRGMIRLQADWDWEGADRDTSRAVELGPSNMFAHAERSRFLLARGRIDEALAEADRAEKLAPGSSIAATFVPWISAKARRYEQAAAGWRRILEMDPHAFYAQVELVFTLNRLGRLSEAAQAYKQAIAMAPPGSGQVSDFWVLEYEVAAGRKESARKKAEYWVARRAKEYVDGYHIAGMYAALGEKDEAMKWLERARQEGSAEFYVLKVDSALDGLRGDPRFEALVKRMRFPE